MDQILHRFNPWWEGDCIAPGIEREKYLSNLMSFVERKDIVLITGLRRVGKTTIILQLIHHMLRQFDNNKVLYVSLDNLALRDYNILEIVDAFRALKGLKHNEKVYLFLDEVHFKKDYEIQLKNLYDMGHCKIFASGSASLEVVMKSPYLTGRQRIVPIHPLSFREYLKFVGQEISGADMHLFPTLAREYVENGGMPEYVLTGDPNVLQSLVDSILYRDIAGRHNIRNREHLKDILIMLAQSVSSPMSLRKISRVLGIPINTTSKILDLLVESNLIHIVEREGKVSERKASPKKHYLADTGLFTVLTENINLGARVENLVYLTLERSKTVRYHKARRLEVDFVMGKHAWESKYKRTVEQKDIEAIKALRAFKSKTVITENKDGELEGVTLKPLWRFLLDMEGG